MSRKRNRRGPDAPRFITLHHWLLQCAAFRALSGSGAKLLLCLALRFNGSNNGLISMSVREAADEIGCSPNHAVKLFRKLTEIGFIEATQRGAFAWKNRHASTWKLLWLPARNADGQLQDPEKRFMRWQPPAAKATANLPRR